MALLTAMTLDEARVIAASFGLDVASFAPIPHGSVNSNFALALANGERIFMRVCEESDHDAVVQQNRLLTHLVAAGVPTPAPLTNSDGASVARHAGKPVALFRFCPGAWICQQRVGPAELERVGEALAQIHVAGEGYRDAPANRFALPMLRARLASLQNHRGELGDEIGDDIARLGARLEEVIDATAGHAPTTVVHGDVFRDNVLWHEGALSAVLDFESASAGHPAFDLMVTMLAWCFGNTLEQPLARALLTGYARRRTLSVDERDACYDQARAAAVRFAITRITDYELRPRGVVVYKDYRRFMQRLAAVEAIGRAAYANWLG
jgi:homoserine kinase type II